MSKRVVSHYKKKLNWNIWLAKTSLFLEDVIKKWNKTYIPVYVINLPERRDRKAHILKEFENKPEFNVTITEACTHKKGTIGLWNSIVKIIKKAKENKDDVIIICEDDHYFTENYSVGLLMKEIKEAYAQGAEILSGGIGGFGQAIPVGYHRYRIDWFWCTQFIVVYSSLFDKILSYQFKEDDTADGVLSILASNKMVIYPFISEQKDFGYSDVTINNMEHKGKIREHFAQANSVFKYIEYMKNSI